MRRRQVENRRRWCVNGGSSGGDASKRLPSTATANATADGRGMGGASNNRGANP